MSEALPEKSFDVLVIGGGPGGMAAAISASSWHGRPAREPQANTGGTPVPCRTVGLVDDNPDAGGQIWRAARRTAPDRATREWFARLDKAAVDFIAGASVIAAPRPGVLVADVSGRLLRLQYKKLILATGSRELLLPFPGWTLPNVTAAGGLQALVKSGLPIAGKRVIVAGSGPLLLAVAAGLKQRGATIVCVAEQVPLRRVARLAAGVVFLPTKFRQAVQLRWHIGAARLLTGWWPGVAHGETRVNAVTLTNGRKTRTLDCDYLACGWGLVPNLDLPLLLGCSTRDGVIAIDDFQQTDVPNVYAVGEITGIGGLEKSLPEGEIAGLAATGRPDAARLIFPARARARVFAAALDRAFVLRDEVKRLAASETIVCRCEDVTLGRLSGHASWTEAKLQTRCGMGACQGRVCGAAAEVVLGWQRSSVRPPIFPTTLGNLRELTNDTLAPSPLRGEGRGEG